MIFLKNIKSTEKLEILVEKIEKNNTFKRDPNDLVMIERNDFTNYLVFYDDFKQNNFLFEKMYEFNQSFKGLKFEQPDENKKYILRYLYSIIYEVYTGNINQSDQNEISLKIKEKEEEQKFSGNIFEDPSNIPKINNEDLKNTMEENQSVGVNDNEKQEIKKENEQNEKKEQKTEWEIDDKLLIFS